jgi:hypothetical protein
MTRLVTPQGVFILTPVNADVSHPCQALVWVAVERRAAKKQKSLNAFFVAPAVRP